MVNGILNVLKPPGMTSHDVISFARRVYGIKKIGHAGTLDPAAAGVLPIAIGNATRLLEYMTDCDKDYRTELSLGYATDTGDDTGKILSTVPYNVPKKENIEKILTSFLGSSDQIPPMYSAIKINGKKMCDLARTGIYVDLKPRKITIHSIKLLNQTETSILFDVSCSKGTYIRSLCKDIGSILNIPSVMSFLVRTRVGVFTLDSALTLEEISENKEQALLPSEIAIEHLPKLTLSPLEAASFQNGGTVLTNALFSTPIRIYNVDHSLLGIGKQITSGYIKPVKVLSRF